MLIDKEYYSESVVAVVLDEDKNGKAYLFRAPNYALNTGDSVVVETSHGEKKGEVIDVLVRKNYNPYIYDMLLRVAGAQHPLKKVLYREQRFEIVWAEEETK